MGDSTSDLAGTLSIRKTYVPQNRHSKIEPRSPSPTRCLQILVNKVSSLALLGGYTFWDTQFIYKTKRLNPLNFSDHRV